MFKSPFISAVFAVFAHAVLWMGAGAAWATEVSLSAPGASRDFAAKLRGASLSLSTVSRENVTPQDMLAAAQADYGRLIGVLYAAGFYGGVISIKVDGREAANIPPLSRPDRIGRITVTVTAGQAFAFGTAQVAPLAPGTALPERFRAGQQARADLVRDAARAGVSGWRDAGHAMAGVADQSIAADHRAGTLDVDVTLAPGPRLRFGALQIDTPGRVRAQRIRQIAGFPTGEVYSPELIRTSAARLRRSGAFRSVVLEESETVGPGDRLDVHARLTDAKPRRVGVGAELSSLEGLTLSGFWMHRNLLGGAERLRFDGEVAGIGGDSGGIDYRFSARFERPATFTPDSSLFVLAKIEEVDDPDYRERNVQLGGGLSHLFSDHLSGEAGLTYRYSEIDDALGSRSLQHLIFPLRLTWDRRNDPLHTTRGFFVDLQADPFIGLNENTHGARLFADARGYRSLGAQDGLIFATRAQVGTVAGARTSDVPSEMLFFSGGAGTVRGQPYQSLAIDLAGGRRIGGRSFMAFSGELRAAVTDTFGVVAFADTGYIGANDFGAGNGTWHSGAGLGVRYATGVGPIRLDVATPLDRHSGQHFEIYIGIGQAF